MTISYSRGVVYLLFSGVFLSTTGIFVRSIESANPWTVLFYRSLTFFLTVVVFMIYRERGSVVHRFRAINVADVLVMFCLGLGFICYLLSVFYTTVANTVFVLSSGPFLSALLGWVVLRERVRLSTWVAIMIAAVGITIMVSGSMYGQHILGMALALVAVSLYAVMIVVIRWNKSVKDMLPATALAGLLAAALCAPFVGTLVISPWDLLMAVCLGAFQIGIGFILITLGTPGVPAAQVPLLTLAETALAPSWVWMLFNEIPARDTIIGGVIILSAVVFQGWRGYRESTR